MSELPSDAIDSLPAPADLGELPERPTRVRYGVLGFLAAMTFVLYLDRVCIGQSADRDQEGPGNLGCLDELGLQRVHHLLFDFRDPDRAVGRSLRLARRAHADRGLVVVLHGPDRGGCRPDDVADRPLPVRSRRGRRLAQCGPRPQGMVPRVEPWPGPGNHHDRHDDRRGGRAHGCTEADQRVWLALDVRGFRSRRTGLGGLLLPLVPGRPGRARGNQPGRALADHSRRRLDAQVGPP